MDREVAASTGSSKRLEVLRGHLIPPPSYSCASGQGGSSTGAGGGGGKRKTKSSAPMSSSKDEVQKAFPRARYLLQCPNATDPIMDPRLHGSKFFFVKRSKVLKVT